MHGNVNEWCQDGYVHIYHNAHNPLNRTELDRRVIRGGCWSYVARGCRSGSRYWYRPTVRTDLVGFRIALVPE